MNIFDCAMNGETQAIIDYVKNGNDLELQDPSSSYYHWTLLIHAARKGQLEVMQILINANANVNAGNQNGETALMIAAEYCQTEAVKILIKAGADLNIQSKQGITALMRAAGQFGDLETVNLLIEAGANLNLKDNWGNTALLRAIGWKKVAIIKSLITGGSDVKAKNDEGKTAVMLAKDNGEIVNMLKEAGAIE